MRVCIAHLGMNQNLSDQGVHQDTHQVLGTGVPLLTMLQPSGQVGICFMREIVRAGIPANGWPKKLGVKNPLLLGDVWLSMMTSKSDNPFGTEDMFFPMSANFQPRISRSMEGTLPLALLAALSCLGSRAQLSWSLGPEAFEINGDTTFYLTPQFHIWISVC